MVSHRDQELLSNGLCRCAALREVTVSGGQPSRAIESSKREIDIKGNPLDPLDEMPIYHDLSTHP